MRRRLPMAVIFLLRDFVQARAARQTLHEEEPGMLVVPGLDFAYREAGAQRLMVLRQGHLQIAERVTGDQVALLPAKNRTGELRKVPNLGDDLAVLVPRKASE